MRNLTFLTFVLFFLPLGLIAQTGETIDTNETVSVETEAETNEAVTQSVPPEPTPFTPTKFNVAVTYGGGSMINATFFYRFNSALRAGIGVGYTPEGAGNSGVNAIVSSVIDVYRLDVNFMTFEFSVAEKLLYFSDTGMLFAGAGPALYLYVNKFPLLGLGIENLFYFRDSGPVYQLGIDLSVHFGGEK